MQINLSLNPSYGTNMYIKVCINNTINIIIKIHNMDLYKDYQTYFYLHKQDLLLLLYTRKRVIWLVLCL